MLQNRIKLDRLTGAGSVARVFWQDRSGRQKPPPTRRRLEMVETNYSQLKPQAQWRPGMTMEKISLRKLDKIPCGCRGWPIGRYRRLVTASGYALRQGPKPDPGVEASGTGALRYRSRSPERIEVVVQNRAAGRHLRRWQEERLANGGGRYLKDIDIPAAKKRPAMACTAGDVQLFVSPAIGGAMVGGNG